MRLVGSLLAALAVAVSVVSYANAHATARYSTRVVSTSPVGAHPPWSKGNFWLGDYIFVSIRDALLPLGLYRKYRVCWHYVYFGRRTCAYRYLACLASVAA